ncbi:glycosyltransferase [Gammaproteobacteria bacterium]|nr:glycosyltransferase [Gammaproteobacteria bacterium]
MACYNAAPYVKEAISSVLRQTYPHTEVIVVDDGSRDASSDIVKRLAETHPSRVRLEHLKHSGPYPARNLGLSHARGEYVAFLDADDWWREDCLEKLLTILQQSKADLAYCGWQNVGEHILNPEPYIPPAYETGDPAAAFLKSCPWPIHAALVRRSVLTAVGGFSERYFSSMDYDLWLRILAHTDNIVRLPEVMAYYRWHGDGQISSTKWKQVMDAVQVRRDFVKRYPDKINHLSLESLNKLVDGQLLSEAYRTYWSRDLVNAQKLFRAAFARRAWHMKDLKYLLPALLPSRVFKGIVNLADTSRGIG